MDTRVKDRMTTAFLLLQGDLSPAATSHLAVGTYGVILDTDSTPVALVTDEDFEQTLAHNAPTLLHLDAILPPTVLVGSEIDMNVLVNSDVMALFNLGARGAIVIDDEGVAGVLPVEAVDAFLGGGEYHPTSKTMGEGGDQGGKLAGAGLAGKFQTPLAELKCLVCGYINRIAELDEEFMPTCANPKGPTHTLKIHP